MPHRPTLDLSSQTPHSPSDIHDSDDKPTRADPVWTNLREDFFQIIDQLPLELHRNLTLLKEFDGLVADQSSQLEQLLRRYVASRRPAAIPAPHSLPRAPSPPTQDLHRSVSDESHELSSSIHQPQHPLANLPHLEPSIEPCGPTHESTLVPIDASTITTASSSEPASSVSIAQENAHRSPLPVAPSVSHLTTTRFASPPQASTASTTVAHPFGPHLPQIHTLACSILQKSQEKVSLARNTYDQIDRQIRVLDFALAAYLVPPVGGDETSELGGESSQYASRSLASTLPISGATGNVAAIIAAAQAARQRERGDEGGHPPSEPAQGNTSARALGDFKELSSLHALDITGEPSRNRSKQTSGKRKHRKSVPAVDQVEEVAEPIEAPPDFDPAGVDAGTTRLEGMKVDPNEPRYCYCKDVSYGTMVGCDNEDCPTEWFHLACVGLIEEPPAEGTWYCKECAAEAGPPKKKQRR